MSTERGKAPLFKLEKEVRSLFKKRLHTIVAYDDGISINAGEELFFPLESINPYIDISHHVVEILNLDANGEYGKYPLYDKTYPGICDKVEKVLLNEWSTLRTRYPETVRWFIGCIAFFHIDAQENPFIYGTPFPDKFYENATKVNKIYIDSLTSTLAHQWNIHDRDSLLEMLDKLYNGQSVNHFYDEYDNGDRAGMIKSQIERLEKIKERGEKSIWAWDLQRMIMLCSGGWICGYLTYEESLDLCLKAAEKLQPIYDSWDDFVESYVLGVAQWQNEAVGGSFTYNKERKDKYEALKKRGLNPWEIPWNHPLKKEW